MANWQLWRFFLLRIKIERKWKFFQWENYSDTFKKFLGHPSRDSAFNAKSHNWYKGTKVTVSGSKLEIRSSHHGLTQIINEPTLILENYSSCINLVFTSHPNIILDSPHQRRILDCCNIQEGELFVITVNGCKPLTIIAKSSTKDLAAVLEPPLLITPKLSLSNCICENLFESYPPPYEKRV